MKKLIMVLFSLLIMGGSTIAQTVSAEAKAQLKEKANKDARKQAKQYKKEGWRVSPGGLPLERQLDRAYGLAYELDDFGQPMYLTSEAISIGQTYNAAKLQSTELSKVGLAGQLESHITGIIDNAVANEQLPEEDAASISKTVMKSKSLISKKLGRTIPLIEAYRDKEGGKKEVMVRTAYSMREAMNIAKGVIYESLRQEGKDYEKQLDKTVFK